MSKSVFWVKKNSIYLKKKQKKLAKRQPDKFFRKHGITVVEWTKEERSGSPQAFVLPKQSLHKLLEQTESGDTEPHKGSHART